MGLCPACSTDVPDGSKFCPQCGSAVSLAGSPGERALGPTVTTPKAQDAAGGGEVRIVTDSVTPDPPAPSHASSSDSIDQARFTPGTMLTERYRIVGLLGKGGMGEVYRADDLKLRQPVALKFLPKALSRDAHKLERFHHEVRVARQVSHPNVCRVYDIGEAQGQPFISMEYIDGEDLAKVLRRMGKPSHDKALQIARQLCAGLAAAHDKGVLHRDLKPHNVMIDGRGRVRITDFGLAGFAEEITGKEITAGTPAYMAPEQLAGREVSVKSDIYSLGLVLYELFTGKRLHEGTTREQIERARTTTGPTTFSTSSDDLDPAIERIVLRCLEPTPTARPSSALAVAAALPGGDPLAAALAAGETPDPEMVANAGEVGGLRPAVAIPCFLAVVLGLIGVAMLNDVIRPYRKAPLPQPPQALAFRAGEVLKNLGYDDAPADQAHGFDYDMAYIAYVKKEDDSSTRWDRLASNRPPAIYFWFRQSPSPLVPPQSSWEVTQQQPPPTQPGMVGLKLDPIGRLVELAIVPPHRAESVNEAPESTDWALLFAEAQLDMASFKSVEPEWNPQVYCDTRAAWEGHFPEQPNVSIRIEAGSCASKPTFFKIIGPWVPSTGDSLSGGSGVTLASYAFVLIIYCVTFSSMAFAKHNWKLRRGDRQGAFRASLVFLTLGILSWVVGAQHVAHPWVQLFRQHAGVGHFLYFACYLWLLYMAFEPYVRRRWPHTLISWTRLLMGRLRDPLVGRDILLGMLLGAAMSLVSRLRFIVPTWFGAPPGFQEHFELSTLAMGSNLASAAIHPWFIFVSFWHLFILFSLRVLLRRQWLAILVYICGLTPLMATFFIRQDFNTIPWSFVVLQAVWLALIAVVVLRFGLLALTFAFLVSMRCSELPITVDFSTWYASGSLIIMIVLVAIAAYGCHTALAGRSIFRDELEES